MNLERKKVSEERERKRKKEKYKSGNRKKIFFVRIFNKRKWKKEGDFFLPFFVH